ncbi:MAG: hypothetical protein M5R38_13760 [Candidatus Methylomirabilis sp.]|nr:hypothetical protein [Candidatus Methylomirabilis sp.]
MRFGGCPPKSAFSDTPPVRPAQARAAEQGAVLSVPCLRRERARTREIRALWRTSDLLKVPRDREAPVLPVRRLWRRGDGAHNRTDRRQDPTRCGKRLECQGPGQRTRGTSGGPPGDLYIVTRVRPHPFFERKGDNIYCEVPISVTEAALGAKIEVPTVDGKASMRIPPETSSGQIFRLREMGVPHLKGTGRGDQFVTVKIILPRNLDTRSQELFRELGRLHPENPRRAIWK